MVHDLDENVLNQARRRIEKMMVGEHIEIAFHASKSNSVLGGRGGDMILPEVQSTNDNQWDIPILKSLLGSDGLADCILVDAPCSSLGTLRRGPNVRWEIEPSSLALFPPIQKSILEQAAGLIRPGGILVYATCTFQASECSNIRSWFLENFKDFYASPLVEGWGPEVQEGLSLDPQATWIQLTPHEHKTDAFYIARFKKAS